MKYTDHAVLSAKKFGGIKEDYIEIHKFIDSSKLFYHHAKHRLLLHNLYGVELCMDLFGCTLTNSDGTEILVRDVAVEHCKEDLSGKVPTLGDWFDKCELSTLDYGLIFDLEIGNDKLKEFILRPYLRSGCEESLVITCSNFGVYLINIFFGINESIGIMGKEIWKSRIDDWLKHFQFKHSWQFTPNQADLRILINAQEKRN